MNKLVKAVQNCIGNLFENEKKEVQMSSTWMPSIGVLEYIMLCKRKQEYKMILIVGFYL